MTKNPVSFGSSIPVSFGSSIPGPAESGLIVSVRNSGAGPLYYGYRQPNYMPNNPMMHKIGLGVGAFMVWWVLWHCYHEPGHLFGEFEYEDR